MAQSGGIQNIQSLLNNVSTLLVPDFQRNYSWQDSQIDAFHEDLMSADRRKADHFLGSTILMKKNADANDKDYLIIDGQQRFTTIFMYVAIIRDRIKKLDLDEKKITTGPVSIDPISEANGFIYTKNYTAQPKFKSNYLLDKFFYDHVLKDLDRVSMPSRHKYFTLDLRKAYSRISKSIEIEIMSLPDESSKLNKLWDFLFTIFTRLQILKIDTTTYSESFDVFMTLNNRGLALGPSDLVKSLFMKYSTESAAPETVEEINESIANDWKEMTDAIGDNGDPDQFLRHFLVSKLDESVQSKTIYSKIENIVTGKDLDPKAESEKLLREIVQKASIYGKLLDPTNPAKIDDSVIRAHCVYLQQLLDSYRIVMLLVIDPEINFEQKQRRELSRLCEILALRWGLTGGNAQELEDIFQQICLEIRKPNFNYENIKQMFIQKFTSDESIKAQFKLEINRTNYVRVVLHKINSIIGSTELITHDPSKLHVEHIAPQSPTNEWKMHLFPNEELDEISSLYSMYSEHWGNKTILDSKINNSIKQKLFKQKCLGDPERNMKGYKDSLLFITNSLVNVPDWTIEEIKGRNDWLIDCFFKIWSVEDASNDVLTYDEWRRGHN